MFLMPAPALAEGGGNIISPDGSLIVVFLLFLLFVFCLNRLLFRPIGRVLDERETQIEGDSRQARAATRNAESRVAEYEARLREAKSEAYRNIEQQRAAGLEKRQSLVDQAREAAVAEIARARAHIERQAVDAKSQLASEARQAADRITQTLLGRTVGGGGD